MGNCFKKHGNDENGWMKNFKNWRMDFADEMGSCMKNRCGTYDSDDDEDELAAYMLGVRKLILERKLRYRNYEAHEDMYDYGPYTGPYPDDEDSDETLTNTEETIGTELSGIGISSMGNLTTLNMDRMTTKNNYNTI